MPTNDDLLLDTLQPIARPRRLAEGEAVFRLGQPVQAVFRVISGEVQLLRYGRDGRPVVLHRALAGDFFAEASLDAARYHCSAVAMRPTELVSYSAEGVRELLRSDAGFAAAWIARLSSELRRQRASVERLSLRSTSERLCHYLMTEGDPPGELQLHGTLSQLADVLGLSRESLYRTLATLKRRGRLQQQDGCLRLLPPGD